MADCEIKSKSVEGTYHYLMSAFSKNKRLIYTRFGDGEIKIMMGQNSQNHSFTENFSKELKEAFALHHQNYIKGLAINYPVEKGMGYGLFYPFVRNDIMHKFLCENFEIPKDFTFESAWFFHYLCVYRPELALNFLTQHIRTKKKLFIGCIPKERIEKLIGKVDYYVEVPSKDSYETIDIWWPKVLEKLPLVDLVVPATGVSGKIVNKRIWDTGLDVQSFDIGSAVDAVDNRKTRKWIKLLGHRMLPLLDDQPKISDKINYFRREFFFRLRWIIKKNKREKLR